MMPPRSKRICKGFLILCEGIDTQNFMNYYLNSDALLFDHRFSNDIQTYDFGGIQDLTAFLENLKKLDNYDNVNKIMVIRDAEQNEINAIQSVCSSFKNNDLPVPDKCNLWKHGNTLSTAFTLMPTCSDHPVPGALEDLCWEVLIHDEAYDMRNEVKTFVEHIKDKYHSVSTHLHKSRLHTFLSVNEKYISLKIGEAAKAGAFDWNHEKLRPLRDLISQGFDSSNG